MDRIIIPAVQEAFKATTAKYTAEELISKRPEVRDQISQFMKDPPITSTGLQLMSSVL